MSASPYTNYDGTPMTSGDGTATGTMGLGASSSPSLSLKRKPDDYLSTPPTKRARMDSLDTGDGEEDEDEMMLWGQDLANNVMDDGDDSDVMSS